MRVDIHELAKGRWRGILSNMGLSQRDLSGKHGPCPLCMEGTDRFRFDDKGGDGTWFCSQCGNGRGVDMVMRLRGLEFGAAADEVRTLVGTARAEPIKAGLTDDQKRNMRRELWSASRPVVTGDPVDTYLAGRQLERPTYSKALRFHPNCRYSKDQSFPAMIAAIQDEHGQGVSLHRTFLQNGEKAPVDSPRMLTAGELPSGSCVRLGEICETIGIAEGIETALAAWDLFGVVTWASLNAHLLSEWVPPAGVKKVIIYGDNDASYTGQAASFALAKRLHRMKIESVVKIAPDSGCDWADMQLKGFRP